ILENRDTTLRAPLTPRAHWLCAKDDLELFAGARLDAVGRDAQSLDVEPERKPPPHLGLVGIERRSPGPAVCVEQPEQRAPAVEQPSDLVDVAVAQPDVDRAEAGVLQDRVEGALESEEVDLPHVERHTRLA